MNEQLTQIYGYLHGMWRYRWSALLIAWVAAIVGWFGVLALPDQYSVKTVVYIDTSSVMKPLLKGLALETDSHDELLVMSRVLLSRENLLSVIREADLDLTVQTPEDRENLVDSLRNSITITGGDNGKRRDAKNNIYELSYRSTDASRAYQVVSSLLSTMIEDTLNSTRTDTVTAQKFLDSQIREYEERLSAAEQQLAEFKRENVGYMPDEKGNYYARLQNAQDAVESTRSDLKLAEQRLRELKRQLRGEDPLIDSQNYLTGTSSRLQKYKEQLKQLLNIYTEKHPDVVSLQATIQDLEASANGENDAENGSMEQSDTAEFNPVYQEMKVAANKASVEVGILKIQLEERQNYVEKLRGSIDIIPEVEAKLTRLNRDYQVTRERYLDLVERRESARLAQSAGKSANDVTFRVIEPPIIPTRPSGPPRLLYLAAALVVALGAGLAWSFLRFMLEPTFFDIRQVSDKTGLPVLGTVSLYLSPQHRTRRRLQLASFLSVVCLLGIVFSGALVFNKQGVVLVGDVVSSVSKKVKDAKNEQ